MGERQQVCLMIMEKIIYKDDVVEFTNFFSPEECKTFIDYLESANSQWQESCFYNERIMDPTAPIQLNTTSSLDMNYLNDLRSRMQVVAEEVFQRPLRNLSLSAQKWMTGSFAGDHSDNSELDGTPNAWRENKLVTIIYLNDDYEGGELYFRDHDISISPKLGSVIVFDVGIENVHGVKTITAGDRTTIMCSWDYADSVYPPEYFEQKEKELMEAEQKHQQQHEAWRKGKPF
jgi:predicted 2-oxoglutarate/Fe(II)-dependent dioxygenase YbiX